MNDIGKAVETAFLHEDSEQEAKHTLRRSNMQEYFYLFNPLRGTQKLVGFVGSGFDRSTSFVLFIRTEGLVSAKVRSLSQINKLCLKDL